MKKIKDYNLPYTLEEKDINNKDKIKTNFIKNMDACKELRLDMWEKIYGKKYFRKDDKTVIECEEEWISFTQKKKEEWFDFVTDKDLSFIQELFYIGNLVKQYKGNVIKATREYKKFIRHQKLQAREIRSSVWSDEEFEEEEEEIEEEVEEGIEEEEFSNFDEDSSQEFAGDTDVPNNSLALAALAAKDSRTLEYFYELPKEVKHAFYDKSDLREVRHRLKCFKDFEYIKKNLKLQAFEDKSFIQKKSKIYNVRTKEQLKEYYISIHKSYIFKMIENNGLIDQALKDIKALEDNGLSNDLYNSNENIESLYAKYMEEEERPEFIDDVGNLGTVMDYSVTSSGKDGNERLAGITAIQATRDIDLKDKSEEKSKYNPIGNFLKRFN